MSQVKPNDTVKVHYTGKLASGRVFDSSEGKDPLEFTMGEGQLIPGFEKGILNMQVNEKKTVEIPFSEAYGDRREDLVQEVSKSQLPPEVKPEVGMGLISENPQGQKMQLTIAEVKEESIVVDANHPLAGQDLIFEIEVVEIL